MWQWPFQQLKPVRSQERIAMLSQAHSFTAWWRGEAGGDSLEGAGANSAEVHGTVQLLAMDQSLAREEP